MTEYKKKERGWTLLSWNANSILHAGRVMQIDSIPISRLPNVICITETKIAPFIQAPSFPRFPHSSHSFATVTRSEDNKYQYASGGCAIYSQSPLRRRHDIEEHDCHVRLGSRVILESQHIVLRN